jgi:uncharacterized membrane protein YgdD (TMEM256/DUF423 family)
MTSLVRLAAALGFTGVALGAFGAHGLRDRIAPGMMDVYRTGVLYHLVHALAALAVGLAGRRVRHAPIVAGLFAGGIVLFSGSLYLLALTGITALGAITPFGGAAFLVGWALLLLTTRLEP